MTKPEELMEEMSVIDYLQTIWAGKKTILIITLISATIGLIIGFTTPKEWSSSAKFLPETIQNSGLSGSLSGLAGLAGVNLNNADNQAINPNLYPDIAQSTPFLISLLEKELYFARFQKTSDLRTFFSMDYKSPLGSRILKLPGDFMALFRSKSLESNPKIEEGKFYMVASQDQFAINQLRKRVSVSYDLTTGVISISVKMQDPYAAAEIADFTKDYIQKYVTDYKISRATGKLEFIKQQIEKREKEVEIKRDALTEFQDSNLKLNTAESKSNLLRLQSEYDLTFSVYSSLSQQLQKSRIEVEDVTPVFQTLEPAKVPNRLASKGKVYLVMLWSIIGIGFGVIIIMMKKILVDLKN